MAGGRQLSRHTVQWNTDFRYLVKLWFPKRPIEALTSLSIQKSVVPHYTIRPKCPNIDYGIRVFKSFQENGFTPHLSYFPFSDTAVGILLKYILPTYKLPTCFENLVFCVLMWSFAMEQKVILSNYVRKAIYALPQFYCSFIARTILRLHVDSLVDLCSSLALILHT